MTAPRSGLVLLARLRPEYASPSRPPQVHAYPLPVGGRAVRLVAPCGNVLEPDRAERVASFRGMPCVPCLLSLPGWDERGTEPVNESWSSGEAELPYVVGDFGDHAVDLRGDRVRHLVAADAVRGELDGRDVVHTMCGHLGWGPCRTVPRDWPLCAECAQVAGPAAWPDA